MLLLPEVSSALVAEPGPCDDGCRFRERCAADRLACEAFSMFAAGEGAPRWQAAPRAPSRGKFEALFAAR
jgi:hypothetical protein